MAAEAVAGNKWSAFVTFVRESYHEVRHKSTWPDLPQVRQASIAIIIFVLIIGLLITIMDTVFRGILVSGIPALFR